MNITFGYRFGTLKDGKGGRSKDSYDWTSLRGHDKRVVLQKLPPMIPSLLTTLGDKVKELWVYEYAHTRVIVQFLELQLHSSIVWTE